MNQPKAHERAVQRNLSIEGMAPVMRGSDMQTGSTTVFVVDDEPLVRASLVRLLSSHDFNVRAFASGHQFLLEHDDSLPGCVLLDLAMPDISGLEVQGKMRDAGVERPIIFLTGQGDVPSSVRALKCGAADFISKPVEESELLSAIRAAVAFDCQARRHRQLAAHIQQRVSLLTPREREVLERVVEGRLNKQIAGEFGTQEGTIKLHRARVMRKLGAKTIVDLLHLASHVGIGEQLRPVSDIVRRTDQSVAGTRQR